MKGRQVKLQACIFFIEGGNDTNPHFGTNDIATLNTGYLQKPGDRDRFKNIQNGEPRYMKFFCLITWSYYRPSKFISGIN